MKTRRMREKATNIVGGIIKVILTIVLVGIIGTVAITAAVHYYTSKPAIEEENEEIPLADKTNAKAHEFLEKGTILSKMEKEINMEGEGEGYKILSYIVKYEKYNYLIEIDSRTDRCITFVYWDGEGF